MLLKLVACVVHWFVLLSFPLQVGWEVGKVLETLKASGHRVVLVLNAGPQSKGDSEGDATDNGSCDPLLDQPVTDHNQLERPESSSAGSDIGGAPCIVTDEETPISPTSPNVLQLERDSMEIKRTVSTPITDSELAIAVEHSPAHEKRERRSLKGDDCTDEGSPQDRGECSQVQCVPNPCRVVRNETV